MDQAQGRRWVLATFYLVILIITADELFVQKRTPLPSRYIGAAVAWFMLALVADIAPGTGGGLAIVATVAFGLKNTALVSKLPGIGQKVPDPTAPPTAAKGK